MRFNLTYKLIFLSTLISILTLTLLLTSCEEPTSSGVGGGSVSVTLSVADVSCTEAWLRVTTQGVNLNEGATITLYRDDSVRSSFPIYSADTLIYDEGLLPSKTYRYKATLTFKQTSGSITKESNTAEAVTMDTTSHEFTWQTFTFGGANGSSYLRDVAIINENDIWAVGEIHTEDTDQWNEDSTEWIQPYNAVHWNGQEWELRRILYRNGFWDIHSLLAFSSNDIWFEGFVHFDGESFNSLPIPNILIGWQINSMWGLSSEDFYVVGNGGNIAHYQNGTWTKIESGTELHFRDISGYGGRIYTVAAKLFSGVNSELYKIENDETTLVDGTNIGLSSVTVYVLKEKLYVYGYYRLVHTEGTEGWKEESEPVNFDGFSKIRGTGYNEIAAAGSYGKIYHFNGASWKERRINVNGGALPDYMSVDIKDDVICAVSAPLGNGATAVAIGRR